MKTLVIRTILCAALFSAATTLAQQTVATAPVPEAILAAKSIFISNAGADAGLFPEPFSGDPSRGYSELYAALQATGQYKLVNDPGQANLILELRLTTPYGPSRDVKMQGAMDRLPEFRLTITDARQRVLLWALTASVDFAILQKTHDRNFDQGIASIVAQFQQISGKPSAQP